jgi:hypothetical protein
MSNRITKAAIKSIFIIRVKCSGYGVFDEIYQTREQAESNLWRFAHTGGELVVEEVAA